MLPWSVAWLADCSWLESWFLQKNFNLCRKDEYYLSVQETVFNTSGHDRNYQGFGSIRHVLKYAFTLAGSGLALLLNLANSSTLAWYLAWKTILQIYTQCHEGEIGLCPPCTGAENYLCLYFVLPFICTLRCPPAESQSFFRGCF